MASVNKMIIIGNLGSEPEMRFTPNGNPVTSFRVATNWRYTTGQGERREETEWFTVVAWNRLAEQCNQFLTKGRLVYAEGRLRTRLHSLIGKQPPHFLKRELRPVELNLVKLKSVNWSQMIFHLPMKARI